MKVRVYYRSGLAADFYVPADITMADFVELAKARGAIKSIEFPE